MKTLIILSLFIAGTVNAEEAKVEIPKALKDSRITTTLKSGKQVSFDGNYYMVVPRKAKAKLPQGHAEIVELHKKVVELHKTEQKKNRVRLLGGYGPSGFETQANSGSVNIKTTNDAMGGIGYDRMLDNTFSIGGAALSNGTYLLDVGVDF